MAGNSSDAQPPQPATGSAGGEPAPRQEPSERRFRLPAWLDHFNAHELKIVFRCWAAIWVSTILVFINPALTSIGVATFFGSILLYIVPPGTILFIYLLASLTSLVGMCLAWAWGLLAMKAALAARPASETQQSFQALQKQAVGIAHQTNQSVAWEAQKLIHDGELLDVRVTVVFYVMCCAFIYAMTRLRYNNAKLILAHIFGVIIMDLFLLIGPTLPSFTATLASLLVKPGAIGVGIGAACCVLFFPQSTSYVVLDKMEALIRLSQTSMNATQKQLANHPLPREQLLGAKMKLIMTWKSVQPAVGFLPLDFSRGRWNADDVKNLYGQVRETMLSCLSLLDFHIARIDAIEKRQQLETQDSGGEEKSIVTEKSGHEVGHLQLLQSANLLQSLQDPESAHLQDRALQALEGTTAEVLQACSRSLSVAAECIHTVNSCRWFGFSQQKSDRLNQDLQDALATLQSARQACVSDTTEAILDSYSGLFDNQGSLVIADGARPPSIQGIVISMVIEERILHMAQATEKLLEFISQLSKARTTHKVWLPNRLQYALAWLFNSKTSVPISGITSSATEDPDALTDPQSLEGQAKEAYRRLRLSHGNTRPLRRRNAISRAIVGTYKWLTNPAGIYSLRMVVVTIAISIPAAIPRTAGFFYREKGMWAVIMAQTALLEYTADFTFSLISRGLGTVAGGVLGMIAWYAGSGSGPGNPYGLAATTGVAIAILVWWRLFLPPAFMQATIMSGATFALVVGFSFDNEHIQQDGLPGKGYEAFWKRLVTVLIGLAASVIVQLFPRPPSATSHVCKTLANSVRTLADHYALLLSHWARPSQHSPLSAVAEQISLDVSETLLSLNETIGVLKVELSFGPFDQDVLVKTRQQCQYMNQSLGRLLFLSSTLPNDLQERLAGTVGILDDRTIGDVMAVLGLIEQSLRTGSPLPERLPAPLVSRFYESWNAQNPYASLTTSLVRDEKYRQFCVALSSYLKFLSTIDDLVLILKRALGESHIIYRWEEA
ncbi:hypothetical protein HIM_09741 [Hirsutella minnesotensis 3608]|uniref:ER transporter 6TM N-terminal domain-containing protein n=1 Tax=Hirsutella minnesotensis 3608 TaxID=1043627 RepID=A0A0F7ZGH0_9HYPO|nr:hypothetical protein HIM_09741 [Hirsutella minnesotensis 3608]